MKYSFFLAVLFGMSGQALAGSSEFKGYIKCLDVLNHGAPIGDEKVYVIAQPSSKHAYFLTESRLMRTYNLKAMNIGYPLFSKPRNINLSSETRVHPEVVVDYVPQTPIDEISPESIAVVQERIFDLLEQNRSDYKRASMYPHSFNQVASMNIPFDVCLNGLKPELAQKFKARLNPAKKGEAPAVKKNKIKKASVQ